MEKIIKRSDNLSLSGGQLAGGNTTTKRADEDYYATDPQAVFKIVEELTFKSNIVDYDSFANILEPCVGEGHIIDGLDIWARYHYRNVDFYMENILNFDIENFTFKDKGIITALDIVDRGYPNTITTNFLKWQTDKKFKFIITNPPYSCAKEFIKKGMELLESDGTRRMYLKLQFLEGKKRKELFDKYPPKYIYVMRSRTPLGKMAKVLTLIHIKSGRLLCVMRGLFGKRIVRQNLL